MKVGDLVRYGTSEIEIQIGDYPKTIQRWNNEGLLVTFNLKKDNICEILDNKTGRVIKRHVSSVKLVNIPRSSRESR